jgi:hypothetical protein
MKYRGVSTFTLAIYMLFLSTILLTMTLPGAGTKKAVTDRFLIEQTVLLDSALSLYYTTHGSQYPDDLATLKTCDILPSTLSLTPFSYTAHDDLSSYNLSVSLESGETYVSPKSN